ncbi:fumarylacetoacetate hydrolase family protein [Erythrobacter westpacificensis]|uniref:Fumarylacetoacetate hydrolase family protein n=1 Tax=Erythrobacter westpacificensis TaxID=1055231 RepID=A0ABP9K480_9SPHN
MKIARFNENRIGLIEDDTIADVTDVLGSLPAVRYPYPLGDPLIANLGTLVPRFVAAAPSAVRVPLAEASFLSPVANPTKLVCAPVNYLKHLDEAAIDPQIHHDRHLGKIQEVALFLKAVSALAGPADGINLRHLDRRTDHELELAVVIGRTADRVSRDQAMSYVAGYTIGLDMTVRGSEDRSFRKSIDSYAVLGPWMVTADEIPDAGALDMSLSVNGELRQKANTADLVVSIPDLIVWASSFYTLHPGDVIFTGTPDGVGPVLPGDHIKARVDSIGEFSIEVSAA